MEGGVVEGRRFDGGLSVLAGWEDDHGYFIAVKDDRSSIIELRRLDWAEAGGGLYAIISKKASLRRSETMSKPIAIVFCFLRRGGILTMKTVTGPSIRWLTNFKEGWRDCSRRMRQSGGGRSMMSYYDTMIERGGFVLLMYLAGGGKVSAGGDVCF